MVVHGISWEFTAFHGSSREFTALQRPLAVIDRSIPVYMCVHNMCVHTCIYPVYGVSREHIPCYVIWPHMAALAVDGHGESSDFGNIFVLLRLS